jgi:hypothetical protein
MLLYLAQTVGTHIDSDVCVIGGGAAGLTIARQIASKNTTVILAEAGGLEYDNISQDCYRGQVIGDIYYDLKDARLRYLGGTTNHWSGTCAQLEPHDFKEKSGIKETEWPITYEDFLVYYKEARRILRVSAPKPKYEILDGNFYRLDIPKSSPPIRFGTEYLSFLQNTTSVRALLHANLIGVNHEGGRITTANFKDYDDNLVTVRARHFVLACGGIENARLLLHINQELNESFGNTSNALGKYFTEHPHGYIGDFVVTNADKLLANSPTVDTKRVSGHYSPTNKLINKSDILNFRLKLHAPIDQVGVKGIIKDIACVAPSLAKTLGKAIGKNIRCIGTIGSVLEQAPVNENRIELGDETDRFGVRRPKLYWQRSDIDRRTTREIALNFAKLMAELDVGRVRVNDWVVNEELPIEFDGGVAAFHHIGVTRMAASADTGVVDKNCRVYGTENLFVAGSSIFPSCGHANPTLPIIAFSLRLADHILSING